MSIYSKKQRWKLFLSIIAIVIVGVTLWYSGILARKVQLEERQKVALWSEAIRKKAELIHITDDAFKELAEQERKKVELWVAATKEMQKDLNDYSFALSIIQNNKSIPLILANNQGEVITTANLEISNKDSLKHLMNLWQKENQPIEIVFAGNNKQKIYYTNSQKYFELQERRNQLIESFNKDLVDNFAMVPVVFLEENPRLIIATNLTEQEIKKQGGIEAVLNKMAKSNKPIEVVLSEDKLGKVYFQESLTLKQLRYFPVIMLLSIGVFLIVAYFLFTTFKQAEQNQVWVGMAKETAHQLGTPLSSLMAWIELLRMQGVNESSLIEMDKDIKRLTTVTERFSKIGSEAKLEEVDVCKVVKQSIDYLEKRISKKIDIEFECKAVHTQVLLNVPLFEWVIENITKNAVDAMEGEGKISYTITSEKGKIVIDVTDTGKGISANKIKRIFEPGYTTKTRGWGLGLSLAKRIIEEHHKGKIAVLRSDGTGTTFRIVIDEAKRTTSHSGNNSRL